MCFSVRMGTMRGYLLSSNRFSNGYTFQALTISAVLPAIIVVSLSSATTAQVFFDVHSADISGMHYDVCRLVLLDRIIFVPKKTTENNCYSKRK